MHVSSGLPNYIREFSTWGLAMPSKTQGRNRLVKSIKVGLSIAVILFIVGSSLITKVVYDKQFPRYDRPDEHITAQLRYSDIALDYPRIPVVFESGENTLRGHIYGAKNTRGLMVVAHGIGGGADTYLPQIMHFVDKGLRVLAFDFTGSYESEGESTKGFPQSIIDLQAALTFIAGRSDLAELPLLLFGHSWGGYAVANVLNYPNDIKGVISVAGVDSAIDMVMEQGRTLMGGFIYAQYPFLWLYQRLLFGEVASFNAVSAINSTDIPVLIIHGIEDELVDYHGSALIAKRDSITNAHVSYVTAETPGRNGHNNLFRTDWAITYVKEVNAIYRSIYDSYGGQIPYEVKKDFYDGIDRIKLNELEASIMRTIDDFIDKSLVL